MSEGPTNKSQKRSKEMRRRLPVRVSRAEYWQLYEMILGHFSENYVPGRIPVTPSDIMHRVAQIKSRGTPENSGDLLRLAQNELEEASEDIAHLAMLERRNQALEKLLFSHGAESISLNLFLRRLLPEDTGPDQRMEIFDKSFEWILQFARWSKGRKFEWPETHRLSALRNEKENGALGIAKVQRERFWNGVDKELAGVFGPLILAYHQFVSSPRTRGSMAHDSAELRRKGNPAIDITALNPEGLPSR